MSLLILPIGRPAPDPASRLRVLRAECQHAVSGPQVRPHHRALLRQHEPVFAAVRAAVEKQHQPALPRALGDKLPEHLGVKTAMCDDFGRRKQVVRRRREMLGLAA